MGVMTAGGRRVDPQTERWFYLGMGCALLLSVFAGFARSFYLHPLFPERPVPPETFFALHGALFSAWILLAVVQPALVAVGRRDLHRMLGRAGIVLAVAMVVAGFYGGLLGAVRPGGFIGMPVPPLVFLVVPVFDATLFALFVGLALRAVHDPQSHKRWMLIATVSITGAAVARWPLAEPPAVPLIFAIEDAFLLPLVAWDFFTRGKPHPVTLIGGAILVASQPLRLMISGTDAWLRFAEALTSMVR